MSRRRDPSTAEEDAVGLEGYTDNPEHHHDAARCLLHQLGAAKDEDARSLRLHHQAGVAEDDDVKLIAMTPADVYIAKPGDDLNLPAPRRTTTRSSPTRRPPSTSSPRCRHGSRQPEARPRAARRQRRCHGG